MPHNNLHLEDFHFTDGPVPGQVVRPLFSRMIGLVIQTLHMK